MGYKVKFADISAYQPSDIGYFRGLWARGYRGVVVKVTEGEGWVSPVWVAQCKNALAVGFQVGVYHFARWSSPKNAITEANCFLNQVKHFGFDKSTVAMVDCETNQYGLSASTYQASVKSWLSTVRPYFPKLSVYASKSWWTSFLNPYDIDGAIVWLAGYGISNFGGITNVGAWQWDGGETQGVDTSWDYTGAFTSATQAAPAPKKAAPKPQLHAPAQSPHYQSYVDNLGVRWYKESGKFTLNYPIVMRWGATTRSAVIATLPVGSVVKYDQFAYSGGYIWIRQPRGNGEYGYLPTGHGSNGRRLDSWGKFS